MAKKIVTTLSIIFSLGLIYVFSVIIGNAFDEPLSVQAQEQLDMYAAIKPEDNAAYEDIARLVSDYEIEFEQFDFCKDNSYLCSAEELEKPELKRFLVEKESLFNAVKVFLKQQKSWLKNEDVGIPALKFLAYQKAYLYHLSQLVRSGKVTEAFEELKDSQKFLTMAVYHYQPVSTKSALLVSMYENKNFLIALVNEKLLLKLNPEDVSLFSPSLDAKKILETSFVGEFAWSSNMLEQIKLNPAGMSNEIAIASISLDKNENPDSLESSSLKRANFLDRTTNYFLKLNITRQLLFEFYQQYIKLACKEASSPKCDGLVNLEEFNQSSFYLRNVVGNAYFKFIIGLSGQAAERIQLRVDNLAEESESLKSVMIIASDVSSAVMPGHENVPAVKSPGDTPKENK